MMTVYIKLSEREQKLLNQLMTIPPDLERAESDLQAEKFSCDEVTRVGIVYVQGCHFEVADYAQKHGIQQPTEILPNLLSSHILDVVKLLLQHGLNPNGVHEDDNIMDSLKFIDNELLAADALALLLEHGGETDLMIPGEGELFEATDFDIFYAAGGMMNRQTFRSIVHCWMVMIGYGARCGESRMQAFREYDSSKTFDWDNLKSHRNYYFGITRLENDLAISIYDKDTMWEVARIK